MELNPDTAKELVKQIDLLKNFESFVNTKNLESYNNINNYSFTRNWNLVVEKHYIIKNFLYFNNFAIFSNKNYVDYKFDFSLHFNDHVELIKCTEKNEVCLIKAKQITNGQSIEIDSSTALDKENRFAMRKFIRIFNKVSIEKFGRTEFTLPYLGYSSSQQSQDRNLLAQELRLLVSGGTGQYTFHSDNNNIILIINELLYGQHIGRSVIYF